MYCKKRQIVVKYLGINTYYTIKKDNNMLEQINSPQDLKKLNEKRKETISRRNKKIYIRCSFRKMEDI